MNKTGFTRFIFTSLVMVLVIFSATSSHAQSPYFQAVTNLNPVTYWPMHDVEAQSVGDIETNYGTAGPLANGYYGDWFAPAPAATLTHNITPGAIFGDSDPCVNFHFVYLKASGNEGSTTNCLIIPHLSPAANLVPPFSVELWYNFTNNAFRQSDIFSSVNANGSEQGLNGITTYSGIRLFLNNNLVVYTYNKNGGVNSVNSTVAIAHNTWYHIVLTDDATNISVYVNGVATLTNIPNSSYSPNLWDPFEIDTGKGYTRDAGGLIDEFAIYTNALDTNAIMLHYDTGVGLSNQVPYTTLVQSANPSIYFRMDSPAYVVPPLANWPVLTNYGTVTGNGVYTPGTLPAGASGPNNGVTFATGFGSGTNAMPGSSMSSFADSGNATAFNPTGTTPFSISAWFKTGYCDSRTQTIVGHGANSWAIVMNPSGQLQCQLGTNGTSLVTSVNVYNDSLWHQVVEVYTPNSTVGQPGTNALFVDGVLDSSTNGVTANGLLPGTNLDVMIGTDPQFTNTSGTLIALGRQFEGYICEVALMTNSLTPGQIQSLYNSAQMPPYLTMQPVSSSANEGAAFTNSAAARGALPLAYQWYAKGIAIPNQTNAALILNPVQTSDAATNYYLVVANSYGSITSAVVSLTVNSGASISAQFPVTYTNLFTLYAGANPTFSVSAGGAQPILYYWFTNGVLDTATTSASLTISNVQQGALSAYCIASNFVSSQTSMVWSASVIADPPNPAQGGFAPYPQAVLALNPIGYWRMNEPDDGLNDGNPDAICHDYAGGNDALYTNVTLGASGYGSSLDVDGETAAQFGSFASTFSDASWIGTNVDVAVPAGGNGEFSVQTWVSLTKNSATGNPQGGGLVCKGAANGGEEFALETTAGGPFTFLVRSANGTEYIISAATNPQLNIFYHVVGVCDEANGKISLYVNGALAGSTTIPALSGIFNGSAVNMTIGARVPGGAAISQQSFGSFNDAALFNYALSSNQVQNEYLQSGIAPFFTQLPPANVNVATGSNLVVSATAVGTLPLSYQWYETNTTAMTGFPIPGQTSASLTINNAQTNDSYFLNVTNSYGSTNSPVVFVGVYTGPLFTSESPQPYTNQFTLFAGTSPTFSVQAVNLQSNLPSVYYQWYVDGGAVPGATSVNFTLANLQAGTFPICYCVASNTLGATTSMVWSASVIAAPTDPYPQALLSLHPLGFWRLDEPDDQAGNGNAGFVAHDYVEGNDGIYTNTILGNAGYNPATDPSAMSAEFGILSLADCDAYGIGGIDLHAPASTSVAFSVEAWVNGYQQTKDAGIVSKGYSSAEQFDLDTGGPTNATQSIPHNFRFFVRDASGAAHSASSSVQPDGNWHHLVGVCDEANSNVTLYVDGAVAARASISPGSGILSSSRSMLIGSRPSSQTSANDFQFVGFVDDVAVFNYALTATQITNEFQGISAPSVNPNPTNIVFSSSGGQLTLSWPADHIGWQLQSNSLGLTATGAWFTVSGSTATNEMILTPDRTRTNVFFRMLYQP